MTRLRTTPNILGLALPQSPVLSSATEERISKGHVTSISLVGRQCPYGVSPEFVEGLRINLRPG
ncbi:MAG: hypothetical protein K8R16_03815 [Anaerolineales bacterium]|nr:hypothetical protein [Anaerolineales bacterium]